MSDIKIQHQELNKIEAYTATKRDPQELLTIAKKRFGVNYNIYLIKYLFTILDIIFVLTVYLFCDFPACLRRKDRLNGSNTNHFIFFQI